MTLSKTKPVLMLLTSILMLHRNSDTSFNFPNFSGPYTKSLITFQGDAFASSSRGVIQLTEVQNGKTIPNSAGRATYGVPVHLWNAKTDKVASFKTTFSFNISFGATTGDGISFFLAPFKSDMPLDSEGGFLGLFNPDTAFRYTDINQIVAVEFDTFQNEWDHSGIHIGIDVNSISSVRTEPWKLSTGVTSVSATVSYNPQQKLFGVIATMNDQQTITVTQQIDFKTVLPEWVSVGFSGATGLFTEEHEILSWTFTSSFDNILE